MSKLKNSKEPLQDLYTDSQENEQTTNQVPEQSSEQSSSSGQSEHASKKSSKHPDHSHKQDSQDTKIEELTDTLKRLQAEFENYKKRTTKENAEFAKHANAGFIKKMLPIIDTFDTALNTIPKNSNPELQTYRQGMELIHGQLLALLAESGLRVIETKNKKFDPFKNEVLMIQESTADDDTILEEVQKGYMLGEYVLRHAKVIIAKKQESQDKTNNK
ncbi:MAG: nucleotide exchange factor GrpE [Candidatus Woesearchaeota archaeon]